MRWSGAMVVVGALVSVGACGGRSSEHHSPAVHAGAGVASALAGSGGAQPSVGGGAGRRSGAPGTGASVAGTGGAGASATGGTAVAGTSNTAAGGTVGTNNGSGGSEAGSGGSGAGSPGTGGMVATGGASGTSADGGQAGESTSRCGETTAACDCNSTAPECQSVVTGLCLGSVCSPSIEDALVAQNWPVDSGNTPSRERREGNYTECDDGSSSFTFKHAGGGYGFNFDSSGHLTYWYQLDPICRPLGSLGWVVCGGDGDSASGSSGTSPSCRGCSIYSDPPPAGTFMPSPGISNGPEPPCEIDASGHLVMPGTTGG